MQICVYGNSTKNNIVGLIVPNANNIKEFVVSLGKWSESSKIENFYNDQDVLAEVKRDLDDLAKINNFNSLEKIPMFALIQGEFNIDNGCLTPTLKLVRRKVEVMYADEIDRLYNEEPKIVMKK